MVHYRLRHECLTVNSIRSLGGVESYHSATTMDGLLIRRASTKELLAIRRIFSLVDMITNTKFSNCPNNFEFGVVWQYSMHSRQQNTF